MEVNDFLRRVFIQVSLGELGNAGLLERTELKYLLPRAALTALLEALAPGYRCLLAGGVMEQSYTTHYFDTADWQLYLDHHNGYLRRWKVRCRRYDDTGDCFFEIKERYNELQTGKRREPIAFLPERLPESLLPKLDYRHLRGKTLQLQLVNSFRRITLVDLQLRERLTLDAGITMQRGGRTCSFPGMLLAELKQPGPDHDSPAAQVLRKLGAVQASFSKYAGGMVLLQPGIKYNNFKPLLLQLNRLSYARPHHC